MNMNDPKSWGNPSFLVQHLGRELAKGRLALLLGAGVSAAFELPNWKTLVDKLLVEHGDSGLKPEDDVIKRVGGLRARHYKDDTARFLDDVNQCLYDGVSLDFAKLRKIDTLSALAALIMASRRGSVSKVITFNYDDLLESYLEYHGFITQSVYEPRYWASSADAVIYHPHGFLPLTPSKSRSNDIVLGTGEYLRMLSGGDSNLWRPILAVVLRSHTVLQVGLSGADIHVQALLETLRDTHAFTQDRMAFGGVRLVKDGADDADIEAMMQKWGVHTHKVGDFADIPIFLFQICQAAREYRLSQDL